MILGRLQRRLQYRFKDVRLLQKAVTHASYANERGTEDNERLEFLGDAVLELVVSEALVARYPAAREGQLSRLRSRLVNGRTLAKLGSDLELGRDLKLGKGEEQTGGRERPGNLADAMEAVLGAVYLDGGFASAREVAGRWMESGLRDLEEVGGDAPRDKVDLRWKDCRSELQEVVQRTHKITPRYEVVSQQGPSHAPTFTVQVMVGDEVFGTGTGSSKREASRNAAEAALDGVRE